MSSIKKQAISGVGWTFAQQFSVQLINFIVQIILARLLMPEMFGLIAMITVFLSIGQTLMDSGMTSSLIRTKEPDQMDYSTVFMTNMLISIVVYIIVFVGAPLVAKFYDQPLLKDILRVFSITFVIRAFVAVHVAKLTKEMNFKTQMKLQVPSTFIGATVGIVMAYLGYGVWSLVFLNLSQTVVFTIQNWIFIPWRPSFVFNKIKFKKHFIFGINLTLSNLLNTIYNDSYRIIIGKFFTPASVGFFNQAETFRSLPSHQIMLIISKVSFPLLSNIQEDYQLKKTYQIIMKLVLFLIIPVMLILAINAKEIFVLLLGEKWMPAVPYFEVLCIASIVKPLSIYNLDLLKVKGKTNVFFKLEVVKKILGIVLIVLFLPFGIMGLVISILVASVIYAFIDMFYCGRLIEYTVFSQIKNVSILFCGGIISAFLSLILKRMYLVDLSNFHTLLVGSFLFTTCYLFFLFLFEKKLILYVLDIFNKEKK